MYNNEWNDDDYWYLQTFTTTNTTFTIINTMILPQGHTPKSSFVKNVMKPMGITWSTYKTQLNFNTLNNTLSSQYLTMENAGIALHGMFCYKTFDILFLTCVKKLINEILMLYRSSK